MNKIINYFIPNKTKWIDIYCFDQSGNYKLLQMRINLKNNKKSFRIANMGFINDYTVKLKIYDAVLSNGILNDK